MTGSAKDGNDTVVGPIGAEVGPANIVIEDVDQVVLESNLLMDGRRDRPRDCRPKWSDLNT